MSDPRCRIVRVRPKLQLVGDNVEALCNLDGDSHAIAGWFWRAVTERGANGVGVVVTFPDRNAETGFRVGHAGTHIELIGGIETLKHRILETML